MNSMSVMVTVIGALEISCCVLSLGSGHRWKEDERVCKHMYIHIYTHTYIYSVMILLMSLSTVFKISRIDFNIFSFSCFTSLVAQILKVSTCNAGDLGSIPGLGRSPGAGNGNPLPYSCLENPMDRGAWWAAVRGVAKSQTRLSDFIFLFLSFPALLGNL